MNSIQRRRPRRKSEWRCWEARDDGRKQRSCARVARRTHPRRAESDDGADHGSGCQRLAGASDTGPGARGGTDRGGDHHSYHRFGRAGDHPHRYARRAAPDGGEHMGGLQLHVLGCLWFYQRPLRDAIRCDSADPGWAIRGARVSGRALQHRRERPDVYRRHGWIVGGAAHLAPAHPAHPAGIAGGHSRRCFVGGDRGTAQSANGRARGHHDHHAELHRLFPGRIPAHHADLSGAGSEQPAVGAAATFGPLPLAPGQRLSALDWIYHRAAGGGLRLLAIVPILAGL